MTSDCTFNEADHPRYPRGQFAPKRNDAPVAPLSGEITVAGIVSEFIGDDGTGYAIQQSQAGYRWVFTEPGSPVEYGGIWLATEGEAVIAAADDWEAGGNQSSPIWAHDLLVAAGAERDENDRSDVAERREELLERRAVAARLRADQVSPSGGRGFIAQEAATLIRDARLVGEGAVEDLKGYAGTVFD